MKGFNIVNADTDSISFCKQDGAPFSKQEQEKLLNELNDLFPKNIKWDHDGIYDAVIVVKAKNYLLKQGDKLTYKGSALKATMKEKALADFLQTVLRHLLDNDISAAEYTYNKMVKDIKNLEDISQWTSKKTVTDAVLNPKRTTEQRILDAIGSKPVQEGDKIRVFFRDNETVALEEDFDGTYDEDRLYEKLYKTVSVLKPVLDISRFPNYKLKKNKKQLELI